MELHTERPLVITNKPSLDTDAITYFREALAFARANYQETIDRISSTCFDRISPRGFFDEYVWAVYVSGFRASTISKIWYRLITAYDRLYTLGDPNTDDEIAEVRAKAMSVFANERKVDAVIKGANILRIGFNEAKGWALYRDCHLSTPEQLQALPFIGKITCFHLARNIGLLQFVKPDVHLVRMARHWKFDSPQALCDYLGEQFCLPAGIVDLVLWYSASTFGTNALDKAV